MKITDFFKVDVCNYASYDNYRKIASIVDGLKPSGRKCLYTFIKNNITQPKKVSQLKSETAGATNYLHGENALAGVIVNLAQNFTGSNNIPLFTRDGAFGTRLIPEAAADRYIFSAKEPYLDKIFKTEDNNILIEQVFEGDKIEPKFYVPIIPMLVINGSRGLTTGFSQKILPRNIKDVIEYLEAKLKSKKCKNNLLPYFNGFTGTIKENKEKNDGASYIICGSYTKINSTKIEITEVPISYTLEEYIKVLDKLEEDKKIKDYQDLSEDGKFKIQVSLWRNQGLNADSKSLLMDLKLVESITENYTSMSEENKVVEYKSIYEIIDAYYNIRLDYYDKRKKYLINELTQKILELYSKYLFIKGVIDKEIIISNKSDEAIEKQLIAIPKIIKINNSYDYLLNMQMRSITKTHYEKLKEQLKELKDQLNNIKTSTVEEMWLNDLAELKANKHFSSLIK